MVVTAWDQLLFLTSVSNICSRWQQSHMGHLSLREVLWMSIVFRFCNKLETFDKVHGIPSAEGFDKFKKRLLALAKRSEDAELFGAPQRDLTLERYLEVLEDLYENLEVLASLVKSSTSTEEIFGHLRKIHDRALGSFVCWQVVADLMEINVLSDEVQTDQFVWLSPESK